MMMSLRRNVLAEITIQPSPSVEASNSADTTVENAAASAICSPVRIMGAEDGRITWRNTSRWVAPSASATWMRCCLTPRTPAAEEATMIGNAVRNSSMPLDRSPVPSQRISRIM